VITGPFRLISRAPSRRPRRMIGLREEEQLSYEAFIFTGKQALNRVSLFRFWLALKLFVLS